jgi:hypothetical protein
MKTICKRALLLKKDSKDQTQCDLRIVKKWRGGGT